MTTEIVAFDVGGANIKLVTSQGQSVSRSFPLWKTPQGLSGALHEMLSSASRNALVVATMTGELADCFETKQEGVHHIIEALEWAAGDRKLQIYLTSGQFVSGDEAKRRYTEAAASNWHALASFVAATASWQNGLLVDVGSTTCDIIPIVSGLVAAKGKTDTQRLIAGELLYVGAERTSIATLMQDLPYRGQRCSIAREWFASTLDVQLVLHPDFTVSDGSDTADGRPATRDQAVTRLGRCICADQDEWTKADAILAAQEIRQQVGNLFATALNRVLDANPSLRAAPMMVAGHGDWFIQSVLRGGCEASSIEYLREQIGVAAARSAPAYALVQLMRQNP